MLAIPRQKILRITPTTHCADSVGFITQTCRPRRCINLWCSIALSTKSTTVVWSVSSQKLDCKTSTIYQSWKNCKQRNLFSFILTQNGNSLLSGIYSIMHHILFSFLLRIMQSKIYHNFWMIFNAVCVQTINNNLKMISRWGLCKVIEKIYIGFCPQLLTESS